jgi:hypothetical protein
MLFITKLQRGGILHMLGTGKRKANVCLTTLLLSLYMAAMMLASAQPAHAQGCIVASWSSQTISPESQGGYLQPGDWELSIGYRHQFWYKHFVGDVE